MKIITIALLIVAALPIVGCAPRGELTPSSSAAAPTAKAYPLRGVIVEVQAKQSALLVKHEDIPGFMPPMTMLFKVDAATLQAAKPDQTIAAILFQKDGDYWLRDVKPAHAK